MSSDQLTLSDVVADAAVESPQHPAERTDDAQARAERPDRDADSERWHDASAPADAGQCRRCGETVEPELQRVLGDNHGRVEACRECADTANIPHNTDAKAAIEARRHRLGVPISGGGK